MKNKVVIAICAVALVAFGVRGLFSSSDEKAIESQLEKIEELLEFGKPLTPISLAHKLGNLKGYLSPEIESHITTTDFKKSFKGFDSIKQGALIGSRLLGSNSLNRLGTQISIQGDKANVSFRMVAIGDESSNKNFREIFSVFCLFEKTGDEWILETVSVEWNS